MLRRRRKQRLPEMLNPGDPEVETCSPGSIEQQLDMCEEGSLRGDEVLHHHGIDADFEDQEYPPLDELAEKRYVMDLSEQNREGDEETGDEHSSGLQGGEPEMEMQPHIQTGIPGDWNKVLKQQEKQIEIVDVGPDNNIIFLDTRKKPKGKSKLKSKKGK